MENAEKTLTKSYYCVIPVYNNYPVIEEVVRRTSAVFDKVLIIDDGSSDANLQELFSALPVEVIRHEHNQGKGAALITALNILKKRKVDYMITLDGDGQHFPEDIPQIIDFLEQAEKPLLLAGCRDFNHAAVPFASRLGRALSNWGIRLQTSICLADSQCGFRAYPVREVAALESSTFRYNYETEIVIRSAWAGIKIVDFPVRVHYPQKHERISHFRPVMDSWRIFRLHIALLCRKIFCR